MVTKAIFNKLVPSNHRQADAARDSRQWEEAARLYEDAVKASPNKASLWVQLGHAQKEVGNLPRAEQAYLRARELEPNNMDIPLQLGHFYKIKNEKTEALLNYKIALAGGLEDVHALHYLTQAGEDIILTPVDANAVVPAIYFDYSDLVAYFKHNRFPTGIQRVQIELFKASLSWTGSAPIRSCSYTDQAGFWANIDAASFGALCNLASQPGSVDDEDWQLALHNFTNRLNSRKALSFPVGSALVNVGTSWWMQDYMLQIRDAKAKYGLRYIPLIYDMIPLITPEYVASGLTASFAAWASSVFMHADAIGTISDCTSRDVSRYAASIQPLARDPVVMPLDAEFGVQGPRPSDTERDLTLAKFGVERHDFVVFVGTLEARKNHLMVFQAWEQLITKEGFDRIPTLVCVGKQGWKFDQTRDYLEARPSLSDKILLLSGISDVELNTLYADCSFTIYSSFYEGWGLPVTESLCHGKVCLTADHSSLPEAGGRFAAYYESGSLRSLTEQAYRLIFDSTFRRAQEEMIAAEYRPRSWLEVLTSFIDQVTDRLTDRPEAKALIAPVTFGTNYEFRRRDDLKQLDLTAAVAEMLRFGTGWYPSENWGAWSRGRRGAIAFKLPSNENAKSEDLLVYLDVRSSIHPTTMTIKIGASRIAQFALQPNEFKLIQAVIPADLAWQSIQSKMPLILQIESSSVTKLSDVNSGDHREVGFGLSGVILCSVSDVISRLSVIERSHMTIARPIVHH